MLSYNLRSEYAPISRSKLICVGIIYLQDSNQPDCYETSDLPEDEQNQVKEV